MCIDMEPICCPDKIDIKPFWIGKDELRAKLSIYNAGAQVVDDLWLTIKKTGEIKWQKPPLRLFNKIGEMEILIKELRNRLFSNETIEIDPQSFKQPANLRDEWNGKTRSMRSKEV